MNSKDTQPVSLPNYLGLALVVGVYSFVGFSGIVNTPPHHDEIIYTIKSWWLFSGEMSWYSDEMRLWYLPNAYTFAGLSQYLIGPGLFEARLPGYVFGLASLILVFFYARALAGAQAAILAALVFASTPAIYSWGSAVSVHGLSNFLIILTLFACSDLFFRSISVRVGLTSLLLCALLFTRLNHLVTVLLLLPVIYLSNQDSRLRITLLIVLGTLVLCIVTILALPTSFLSQADTLGLHTKLLGLLGFPNVAPFQYSDAYQVAASVSLDQNAPTTQSASAGKFDDLFAQTSWIIGIDAALLKIRSMWPDLFYGSLSLYDNWTGLIHDFGLIIIGTGLALLVCLITRREALALVFAISFFIFIFISFLKGNAFCSSCPVIYSGYFTIPGVIATAIGISLLIKKLPFSRILLTLTLAMPIFIAHTVWTQISEEEFTAEHKSDLAELAQNIRKLVPEGNGVLPVGTLPGAPIRLGLFIANRQFPPALINPVFTFTSLANEPAIAQTDKKYIQNRGHWTPQHLLDWIRNDYAFIITPTYLYFDDHKYKYWFRNLYYPAKARELIQEHFTCNRIPGHYKVIHPIDFCKRKTAD